MNFYLKTQFRANYIMISIKKKPVGTLVLLILKNYMKLNISYMKKGLKYKQ